MKKSRGRSTKNSKLTKRKKDPLDSKQLAYFFFSCSHFLRQVRQKNGVRNDTRDLPVCFVILFKSSHLNVKARPITFTCFNKIRKKATCLCAWLDTFKKKVKRRCAESISFVCTSPRQGKNDSSHSDWTPSSELGVSTSVLHLLQSSRVRLYPFEK